MAIIGILAVVGFGSFTNGLIKSRDTQRKNDLSQIAKALEMYNNDTGSYPSSVDFGGSLSADIKGTEAVYMKEVPQDASSGRSYIYVPDSSLGSFVLYAALENTEDRDAVKTAAGVKTDWGIACGSVTIMCNYKLTETGLIRTK